VKTHRFDWVIRQGATAYVPFALKLNGVTLDLAEEGDGYTVGRLTVRDEYGGDEIVTLTTDNGGVVIDYFTDDSGTHSGYWFASAATTRALTDWGDGQYEFVIYDAADEEGPATHVEKPFNGSATLSPRIAP
jgi:hypothetical protein